MRVVAEPPRAAPLLAVAGLLLIMVGVLLLPRLASRTAAGPAPADVFMTSVATRDGALGWRQLCPDVQAVLPLPMLDEQTASLRALDASTGISVSVRFVAAQTRAGGGEARVYLATAHWPDGTTLDKTFTLTTRSSGCVEDIS